MAAKQPQVQVQRHRALRDVLREGAGAEVPACKLVRVSVGMAVQALENDSVVRPVEALGGVGAIQCELEGVRAVPAPKLGRPDGVVAIRVGGRTPARKLNIDLVGRVRPHVVGRVGEQPQHHVRVELVDRSVELELVGAKAEALGGFELGAGPRAIRVRDLQVQRAAAIDPDVAGVPGVRPRPAAARAHPPCVARKLHGCSRRSATRGRRAARQREQKDCEEWAHRCMFQ